MNALITIRLAHLYPKRMNIYGDRGNIMTLQRRCEWRGFKLLTEQVEVGDKLNAQKYDLFFFGGGQDVEQYTVSKDLASKADDIKQAHAEGAAFLAVCGGYQLLGKSYRPNQADELAGVGIFPVTTIAGPERLIGNVVATPAISELGGQALVGFENHSGLTTLEAGTQPLANVRHGYGNNGSDGTEGCVSENAVGTYLHGALLPKNPHLADWLLSKALQRRHPGAQLTELARPSDVFEHAANATMVTRYG